MRFSYYFLPIFRKQRMKFLIWAWSGNYVTMTSRSTWLLHRKNLSTSQRSHDNLRSTSRTRLAPTLRHHFRCQQQQQHTLSWRQQCRKSHFRVRSSLLLFPVGSEDLRLRSYRLVILLTSERGFPWRKRRPCWLICRTTSARHHPLPTVPSPSLPG